jgi:hypothetical protein
LPIKVDTVAPKAENAQFVNKYNQETGAYDHTELTADFVDYSGSQNSDDCSGMLYSRHNFAINLSVLEDPNLDQTENNMAFIDSFGLNDLTASNGSYSFEGDNECKLHIENVKLPDSYKPYLKNGINGFGLSIADAAGNSKVTRVVANLTNDNSSGQYLNVGQDFDPNLFDFVGSAESSILRNPLAWNNYRYLNSHDTYISKTHNVNDSDDYALKFAGHLSSDVKIERCSEYRANRFISTGCPNGVAVTSEFTQSEVDNGAKLTIPARALTTLEVYLKDLAGQWELKKSLTVYLAVKSDEAPEVEFDSEQFLGQFGITADDLADDSAEVKSQILERIEQNRNQPITLEAWAS